MQVQRLEQSSAVKQALIDVYSTECARLQGEVKRLSAADVATSSEDVHHHQQQQSRHSATAANIQKLSQVFSDLSALQGSLTTSGHRVESRAGVYWV